MIPVVSLSNLISALFFSGITLKLYFAYKKTKDGKIENFFKAFFLLTTVFFLLATPGLVFTNLKILGLVFSVYPSLAFLGFIYLGLIPLKILNWKKGEKIFLGAMIAITILMTVLNLIHWGPAVVHSQSPFIYWEDTRGSLVNSVLGALLGLGLLSVIIFFLLNAIRASDKYVRIRAFLIMAGLLVLSLMVLINFVFGTIAQPYITSTIASFLGIFSGFILFFGVFYRYVPSA